MNVLLKSISEYSSLLLFIATLILAVITYLYLKETKLIRKVAERTFTIETSPKVFLENITCVTKLNSSKKEIEVTAQFKIKNVGKSEARKFEAAYTISCGKMKMEDIIGPIPYLLPTQGVRYETKMLSVRLNDKNFAIAKEAMDTKKPLVIPKDFGQPIFLDLNLKYTDQNGKDQSLDYRCKYIFHTNSWVFIVE